VRAATAVLVHHAALLADAATHAVDHHAPSAPIARALSDAEARDAQLFLAIPDVASEIAPELAAPPGLDADERVARRWKAHRKQVRGAVDVGRRAALSEKLAAALSRPG
jgi:hypothetical protein